MLTHSNILEVLSKFSVYLTNSPNSPGSPNFPDSNLGIMVQKSILVSFWTLPDLCNVLEISTGTIIIFNNGAIFKHYQI